MAVCLWPDLLTAAREDDWPRNVDLLLAADLPVGVYDLAVDVLHPEPAAMPTATPTTNGPTYTRPYPWHQAGFTNRPALVAELRRRGYDGPTSYSMSDLWTLLDGLRGGPEG